MGQNFNVEKREKEKFKIRKSMWIEYLSWALPEKGRAFHYIFLNRHCEDKGRGNLLIISFYQFSLCKRFKKDAVSIPNALSAKDWYSFKVEDNL